VIWITFRARNPYQTNTHILIYARFSTCMITVYCIIIYHAPRRVQLTRTHQLDTKRESNCRKSWISDARTIRLIITYVYLCCWRTLTGLLYVKADLKRTDPTRPDSRQSDRLSQRISAKRFTEQTWPQVNWHSYDRDVVMWVGIYYSKKIEVLKNKILIELNQLPCNDDIQLRKRWDLRIAA
jgi:hypothetical protein